MGEGEAIFHRCETCPATYTYLHRERPVQEGFLTVSSGGGGDGGRAGRIVDRCHGVMHAQQCTRLCTEGEEDLFKKASLLCLGMGEGAVGWGRSFTAVLVIHAKQRTRLCTEGEEDLFKKASLRCLAVVVGWGGVGDG